MNTNDVKEIITVGDLIDHLNKYPRIAAVLKSDMMGTGYNTIRIVSSDMMAVRANPDQRSDCSFIDATLFDVKGGSFLAVVL